MRGPSQNTTLPKLNILVVGREDYINKLWQPIQTAAASRFHIPVLINRAEVFQNVIDVSNNSTFDSVIMLIDTSRTNFAAELSESLCSISAEYLATRLLLVRCGASSSFSSALEFKRITDQFQINYFNVEINEEESRSYLVKKLVLAIEHTTGVTSGNPLPLTSSAALLSYNSYY